MGVAERMLVPPLIVTPAGERTTEGLTMTSKAGCDVLCHLILLVSEVTDPPQFGQNVAERTTKLTDMVGTTTVVDLAIGFETDPTHRRVAL